MMNKKSLHIHILAVCGTGTASLAGCLAAMGHLVSGSDAHFNPPMGPQLENAGVRTYTGFDPQNLVSRPDLVVIGNAVHRDNPEAREVYRLGIPHLSFPQAVRRFLLHDRHPVVIAGTHGKTTTTAATAWTLKTAGLEPGFLVGGVVRELDRSFAPGAGRPFVIEGDEYETSFFDKGPKFLHYAPQTLVITGLEYDHADNFDSLEALQGVFLNLTALLPCGGTLIYNTADPFLRDLATMRGIRAIGYGLNGPANVTAGDIAATPAGIRFTLHLGETTIESVQLSRWGRFNLENILAAAAVAMTFGLEDRAIVHGLETFPGVRRRQEVIGRARGITVIDDFAHHPTAVALALGAIAEAFAPSRVWAVFEPRSYTSQTSLFQDDYASALMSAASAIIAPLPPTSKVPPEKRLDREQLVESLAQGGVEGFCPDRMEDIPEIVAAGARSGDVVMVMSSGDFQGMPARILDRLSRH